MTITNTFLLATALGSTCAWAQGTGFRGELGGMATWNWPSASAPRVSKAARRSGFKSEVQQPQD